jgi:hypothetical protein
MAFESMNLVANVLTKTSTKCIYYLIAPILTNLFLCYHLGHLELSGQTLMITRH